MNRWRRMATVATFEFLSTVKRRGYLIATFGMPLFMAAYGGIVAVPVYLAERQDKEQSTYGVVDGSGLLNLREDARVSESQVPDALRRTLESAGQRAALERIATEGATTFRPFADERAARAALASRSIKGYFVIPANYLEDGNIDSYGPEAMRISSTAGRTALSDLIRAHLLAGRIDGSIAARVLSPLGDMRRFAVTRTGEVVDAGRAATAARIVVPVAFMALFLMSVLMTSGYLMQGTAMEKENKVVDVLLASARPDEILAGKLLGLGASGLLQVTVWLSFVLIGGIGVVPLLIAARVQVPWGAVAAALPFFIVAFLFFGSLMMGTGSLGSNMREAQQLAMVWSLTAAIPLIFLALLIREPHGVPAQVMTWIPFSSAAVVVLRASLDPAFLRWWEVAGTFLVLVGSTWLAIGLGARLFRVGLLSSGSRPTFREVLRQARL